MKRLALVIIACFCILCAHAAYLKDVPMTLTQPDGTILHCFASGDEYFNYLHDANGYTIIQHPVTGYYVYVDKHNGELVATDYIVGKYDPASKHLKPYNLISPEEWQKRRKSWEVPDIHPKNRDFIPNHGTLNNIAIFIRFADDENFANTYSSIDNMFNDETEGAVSMINYFRSASYGAIEIPTHFYPEHNGETIISYQDIYPKNYFQPYNASTNPNGYTEEQRRSREFDLLERALNYIENNNMIPNNLDIDYDNDGCVDNVCFIVRGNVGAWSSLLWPHQWSLYDRSVTINEKVVFKYNFQLADASNYFNTSTMCHEMNHSLGAPDLYHYNENYLNPVARWDLMATNSTPPQHCGAYMKMKYGHWIDDIPEITQAGTYTLNPISSPTPDNVAYKIATEDPNQFYVLEYRNTSTPFESGLPGSGLLIYRIDTRFNGNADYKPSEGTFDEVYIFRPDGSYSSDGNSSSAFFSSASGRTEFSPSTNPNPFFSDGTSDNNTRIYDITSAGSTISFKYGTAASCNPPTNLDVTVNGRNAILTWDAADNAQSYNVYRNNNLIGNTSATNYTDANLSYGNHEFFIKSVDAQGSLSTATELVSAVICPIPSNLNVTKDNNDAVLTWDEPEWVYPEAPLNTLTYGTQSLINAYVSFVNGGVYWGHRHPTEDISSFDGMKLYSVDFYAYNPGEYQLLVFKGATTSEDYTIPTEQVLCQSQIVASSGWYTIDLDEPVIIDGEQDLWLFMHDSESIPNIRIDVCNATGTNGCYYSTNLSEHTYHNINNYAFLIKAYLTDGTYTYNLYDNGTLLNNSTTITNTNYTVSNITSNTIHQYTVTAYYSGGESTPSNKASLTIGAQTIGNLDLGDNDRMTIAKNSILTVTGALSCTNPDHLILEDGAQLIHNSSGVKATLHKTISAYSESSGWNFIASPMTTLTVDNTAHTNIASNDFDLYQFNQSANLEWENWKQTGEHYHFNLEPGKGYLYAHNPGIDAVFIGELTNPQNGEVQVSYSTNNTKPTMRGWNLIGNPFACNATLNMDCYTISGNAINTTAHIAGTYTVAPCEGVMVKATGANQNVIFTKASQNQASQLNQLEMTVAKQVMSRGTATSMVHDNAIVNFNAGSQLEKLPFNADAAKLYIPQDGKDYAIVSSEAQGEMPVNFKAKENGTYTLSISTEGMEMKYLHLIDNMTGNDVDLLQTPSYSFEAKTTDYESRFKLVFVANNEDSVSAGSTTFAIFSNGSFVINNPSTGSGPAELQVIDITGRIVKSESINGCANINVNAAPGVYMLRLINGDNLQTQKIIIE